MPVCEHCGRPLAWVDPDYSNGFKGGFVCQFWDFMHDCFQSNKDLDPIVLVSAVRHQYGSLSF